MTIHKEVQGRPFLTPDRMTFLLCVFAYAGRCEEYGWGSAQGCGWVVVLSSQACVYVCVSMF